MGNFIIQLIQLLITIGLIGFIIYSLFSGFHWTTPKARAKKLARQFMELNFDERHVFHDECIKIENNKPENWKCQH